MHQTITDAMLREAAQEDDLDVALAGVMDTVGITDGGVAALVFGGTWEEAWPTASPEERLRMLKHWRSAEDSLNHN